MAHWNRNDQGRWGGEYRSPSYSERIWRDDRDRYMNDTYGLSGYYGPMREEDRDYRVGREDWRMGREDWRFGGRDDLRYGRDENRWGRDDRGLGERIADTLGFGGQRRRGPKNYRRSDIRIYEDVCDRIAEHPSIDASEVEVEVKDGEVTLKGTVEERWMKRLAEDIAEVIPGVQDVHNQIRVRGGVMDKLLGTDKEKQTTTTTTTTQRNVKV
jgi:hypothetical protein